MLTLRLFVNAGLGDFGCLLSRTVNPVRLNILGVGYTFGFLAGRLRER